jgi:hypothetical protein
MNLVDAYSSLGQQQEAAEMLTQARFGPYNYEALVSVAFRFHPLSKTGLAQVSTPSGPWRSHNPWQCGSP